MAENLPDTNVGNIEYISKADAVEAVRQAVNRGYGTDYGVIDSDVVYEVLDGVESADVVQVETLKAEIYKLKCQQDCKNQDYYTGYMSALSTVEGILAWMEEEDE